MHLKLICSTLFAVSLGSTAFAAGEEYVEVLAPNECCDAVPGSLAIMTGWGGSAASLGAATFREAALNAATQRAAQQRAQQQQQPQEQQQNTQYNDAIQNKDAAKQSNVWDFLMNLSNHLFGSGRSYESTTTKQNEDGTVEESKIQDCVPSGMFNPKNPPCTQHKFELFIDPLDGEQKWSYTMSVIEPKYNPIHVEAEGGYYGKVVGNQSFTLVFQSKEDLLWQLQRVGGRH